LVVEPLHYHEGLNRWCACLRNRRTANAAWEQYSEQINPGQKYPDHYVRGFKQAVADYLEAGGTGALPPIPPRQYWGVWYQTPAGHQAVEQWFAGYSQGATMAQERGFRHWITVPSSLALPSTQNVDDQPADLPMPDGLPAKPAADLMRPKDFP
jgi:hypothetical protein